MSRAARMSWCPALASRWETADPMPPLAPVTRKLGISRLLDWILVLAKKYLGPSGCQ